MSRSGCCSFEWGADARGAITVRNLMQMSSGLAPQASLEVPDLTAAVLSRPLAGSPGVTRVEQPADPQLLALALERATQQRYAEYLSTVLWRRLGAADAWLWLDHPGGTAHADCCMFAHQGDWIRVGQLLLRDGNYRGTEVIRRGWVSLMRAPAKSDPDFGSFLRVRDGARCRVRRASRPATSTRSADAAATACGSYPRCTSPCCAPGTRPVAMLPGMRRVFRISSCAARVITCQPARSARGGSVLRRSRPLG